MIFLSLKFNKIEMIKINNKNLINNLMNSKFNSNNNRKKIILVCFKVFYIFHIKGMAVKKKL
jgi:hypothetical protein